MYIAIDRQPDTLVSQGTHCISLLPVICLMSSIAFAAFSSDRQATYTLALCSNKCWAVSLPSPVYEISLQHGHGYYQLTLPPVTIATLPERSGISSTLNSESGTKNPSAVRSNIAILHYCLWIDMRSGSIRDINFIQNGNWIRPSAKDSRRSVRCRHLLHLTYPALWPAYFDAISEGLHLQIDLKYRKNQTMDRCSWDLPSKDRWCNAPKFPLMRVKRQDPIPANRPAKQR